jgi:hypothetical protein
MALIVIRPVIGRWTSASDILARYRVLPARCPCLLLPLSPQPLALSPFSLLPSPFYSLLLAPCLALRSLLVRLVALWSCGPAARVPIRDGRITPDLGAPPAGEAVAYRRRLVKAWPRRPKPPECASFGQAAFDNFTQVSWIDWFG